MNYQRKNITKELRQYKSQKGYMFVTLFKNGKEECKSVHRIVGETFLENKHDNFVINHIDGDKTNNRVENLEWCSQAYNIRNAFENGLNKPKTKGEHHLSRKVKQYDINNNYIKTWDCIKDIQQELGFKSSNISACCRSEMKSAYGYKWKYVEYIETDKIRDKIEILEKLQGEFKNNDELRIKIIVLKELLEEQ